MPLGTILRHSSGWNEGEARYETLGKQKIQKLRAPLGAALSARALEFIRLVVPPLKGLNKYTITNNPGHKPWAMKSIALAGLIY